MQINVYFNIQLYFILDGHKQPNDQKISIILSKKLYFQTI